MHMGASQNQGYLFWGIPIIRIVVVWGPDEGPPCYMEMAIIIIVHLSTIEAELAQFH